MDRGIITISETGVVTIPTAPVWMTKFEIADLFGVFSCDLRKAIHTIYKSTRVESSPPEMPTTTVLQLVCTSRLAKPAIWMANISSHRWSNSFP